MIVCFISHQCVAHDTRPDRTSGRDGELTLCRVASVLRLLQKWRPLCSRSRLRPKKSCKMHAALFSLNVILITGPIICFLLCVEGSGRCIREPPSKQKSLLQSAFCFHRLQMMALGTVGRMLAMFQVLRRLFLNVADLTHSLPLSAIPVPSTSLPSLGTCTPFIKVAAFLSFMQVYCSCSRAAIRPHFSCR